MKFFGKGKRQDEAEGEGGDSIPYVRSSGDGALPSGREIFGEDPVSPSTPPSLARDPLAPVASISSFLRGEGDERIKYRGFYTSITHIFQTPDAERTDACALVCCGILQSDRDRYLLMGIPPPTCTRRLFTHILVPLSLFLVAVWAAFHIHHAYWNQLIATLFVSFFFLSMIFQCCKGRWKRIGVRKELLWRKHQLLQGNTEPPTGNDGPPDEDKDGDPYLQGQTVRDLCCAHGFLCGCYNTDLQGKEPPVAHEFNLIHKVWNTLVTRLCCGDLCGCHLQCCGMCALAQEARELERFLPAASRRVDYVTMETWHNYYPKILKDRDARRTSKPLPPLSVLSKQLLQVWGVIFVLLCGYCAWKRFNFFHVLLYLAVFVHAWLFVWCVHWPWHKHDVSLDAVVKAFSCGFVLSTTLAVAWETVIGIVLRLVMDVLMLIFGVGVQIDEDGYGLSTLLGPAGFAQLSATSSHEDYLETFGREHPIIYTLYIAIHAYCIAAFLEEVAKYLGYKMISDHPDLWTKMELVKAVEAAEPFDDESVQEAEERQPTNDGESIQHRRRQWLWSGNDLPVNAQDRDKKSVGSAITVLMVAVALGMACCENLLYVFVYNDNELETELTVLIARMLFPVHPLCAAIQSIGVVKRDVEKQPPNKLGKVLYVAIIVHGTFDFLLLFLDFLNYEDTVGGTLLSYMAAIFVASTGLVYYFKEGTKQRLRLQGVDRQAVMDNSTLL